MASGTFPWHEGKSEYLASHRTLTLKAEFGEADWAVVLSEPTALLNGLLAPFVYILLGVGGLSLLLFASLCRSVLRRTVGSIETFRIGTRLVAEGQFHHRVQVEGDDEFAQLAESFNTRSERLGQRVASLTTLDELQRTILKAPGHACIVEAMLNHLPRLIDCASYGVLIPAARTGAVQVWVRHADGTIAHQNRRFLPYELEELGADVDCHEVLLRDSVPAALAPLAAQQVERVVLLPVHHDGRLSSIIAIGCERGTSLTVALVEQIRKLAQRMTIGIANARRVSELEHLNWGTLVALARTVDAKTPWTMGHAERVMELSGRMGRHLGLGDEDLRSLRRGALLHDIGMARAPQSVVEKAGSLADEEIRELRDHVRLGVRILEPLPEFSDVLPIVLEHHERIDGSGYPAGLVGEAVCVGARIVAVADTFDAMRCNRPHRNWRPEERVLQYLREESGHAFDPLAVAALVHVLRHEPLETPRPWLEFHGPAELVKNS